MKPEMDLAPWIAHFTKGPHPKPKRLFFYSCYKPGGGVKPIYKKVRTTFGMFWWAYLQHKMCIKRL